MTVAPDTDIARYYYVARTVHLERHTEYRPGWLFYTRTRADFDVDLATRTPGVVRASALKVGLFVVRRGVRVLEMPEPLAVPVWPHAVIIHFMVLAHNVLRRRRARIRIVTYAIENLDPTAKIRGRLPLPRRMANTVVRLVGGFLLGTTSKVVFGTQAAFDTYAKALPHQMRRTSLEKDLVWALPQRSRDQLPSVRPLRLAFLGTFEERKGIHHLMRIWPAVRRAVPGAELLLIGKAGDIDEVRSFAESNSADVQLVEDPPRRDIFRLLAGSKALVLFSQPTPVWKEQVGLPILEALSQGCEIVSSDETGIADWLRESGHHVVAHAASDAELVEAIASALTSTRTPQEIVADLPSEDTRETADKSMFS